MTQTILLIDDDDAILKVASSILEAAGYKAIPFASPVEAIAYYTLNQHHIHAILLDMTMTEMDGIQCAKALWDINAQAAIILSSGYNLEDIMQDHQDIQFHAFLQKPYRQQMLIKKVQSVLPLNQTPSQLA